MEDTAVEMTAMRDALSMYMAKEVLGVLRGETTETVTGSRAQLKKESRWLYVRPMLRLSELSPERSRFEAVCNFWFSFCLYHGHISGAFAEQHPPPNICTIAGQARHLCQEAKYFCEYSSPHLHFPLPFSRH